VPGQDVRVGVTPGIHLGVGDERAVGPDTDRLLAEVEARSLPVADDVLEVDLDLADVVQLRSRDEVVDGPGVSRDQRSRGEP